MTVFILKIFSLKQAVLINETQLIVWSLPALVYIPAGPPPKRMDNTDLWTLHMCNKTQRGAEKKSDVVNSSVCAKEIEHKQVGGTERSYGLRVQTHFRIKNESFDFKLVTVLTDCSLFFLINFRF